MEKDPGYTKVLKCKDCGLMRLPDDGSCDCKEDMFRGFAYLDLKGIRKWAENISGNWNGDNPGRAEDRAGQANDIIEKVDELIELINGMEEL